MKGRRSGQNPHKPWRSRSLSRHSHRPKQVSRSYTSPHRLNHNHSHISADKPTIPVQIPQNIQSNPSKRPPVPSLPLHPYASIGFQFNPLPYDKLSLNPSELFTTSTVSRQLFPHLHRFTGHASRRLKGISTASSTKTRDDASSATLPTEATSSETSSSKKSSSKKKNSSTKSKASTRRSAKSSQKSDDTTEEDVTIELDEKITKHRLNTVEGALLSFLYLNNPLQAYNLFISDGNYQHIRLHTDVQRQYQPLTTKSPEPLPQDASPASQRSFEWSHPTWNGISLDATVVDPSSTRPTPLSSDDTAPNASPVIIDPASNDPYYPIELVHSLISQLLHRNLEHEALHVYSLAKSQIIETFRAHYNASTLDHTANPLPFPPGLPFSSILPSLLDAYSRRPLTHSVLQTIKQLYHDMEEVCYYAQQCSLNVQEQVFEAHLDKFLPIRQQHDADMFRKQHSDDDTHIDPTSSPKTIHKTTNPKDFFEKDIEYVYNVPNNLPYPNINAKTSSSSPGSNQSSLSSHSASKKHETAPDNSPQTPSPSPYPLQIYPYPFVLPTPTILTLNRPDLSHFHNSLVFSTALSFVKGADFNRPETPQSTANSIPTQHILDDVRNINQALVFIDAYSKATTVTKATTTTASSSDPNQNTDIAQEHPESHPAPSSSQESNLSSTAKRPRRVQSRIDFYARLQFPSHSLSRATKSDLNKARRKVLAALKHRTSETKASGLDAIFESDNDDSDYDMTDDDSISNTSGDDSNEAHTQSSSSSSSPSSQTKPPKSKKLSFRRLVRFIHRNDHSRFMSPRPHNITLIPRRIPTTTPSKSTTSESSPISSSSSAPPSTSATPTTTGLFPWLSLAEQSALKNSIPTTTHLPPSNTFANTPIPSDSKQSIILPYFLLPLSESSSSDNPFSSSQQLLETAVGLLSNHLRHLSYTGEEVDMFNENCHLRPNPFLPFETMRHVSLHHKSLHDSSSSQQLQQPHSKNRSSIPILSYFSPLMFRDRRFRPTPPSASPHPNCALYNLLLSSYIKLEQHDKIVTFVMNLSRLRGIHLFDGPNFASQTTFDLLFNYIMTHVPSTISSLSVMLKLLHQTNQQRVFERAQLVETIGSHSLSRAQLGPFTPGYRFTSPLQLDVAITPSGAVLGEYDISKRRQMLSQLAAAQRWKKTPHNRFSSPLLGFAESSLCGMLLSSYQSLMYGLVHNNVDSNQFPPLYLDSSLSSDIQNTSSDLRRASKPPQRATKVPDETFTFSGIDAKLQTQHSAFTPKRNAEALLAVGKRTNDTMLNPAVINAESGPSILSDLPARGMTPSDSASLVGSRNNISFPTIATLGAPSLQPLAALLLGDPVSLQIYDTRYSFLRHMRLYAHPNGDVPLETRYRGATATDWSRIGLEPLAAYAYRTESSLPGFIRFSPSVVDSANIGTPRLINTTSSYETYKTQMKAEMATAATTTNKHGGKHGNKNNGGKNNNNNNNNSHTSTSQNSLDVPAGNFSAVSSHLVQSAEKAFSPSPSDLLLFPYSYEMFPTIMTSQRHILQHSSLSANIDPALSRIVPAEHALSWSLYYPRPINPLALLESAAPLTTLTSFLPQNSNDTMLYEIYSRLQSQQHTMSPLFWNDLLHGALQLFAPGSTIFQALYPMFQYTWGDIFHTNQQQQQQNQSSSSSSSPSTTTTAQHLFSIPPQSLTNAPLSSSIHPSIIPSQIVAAFISQLDAAADVSAAGHGSSGQFSNMISQHLTNMAANPHMAYKHPFLSLHNSSLANNIGFSQAQFAAQRSLHSSLAHDVTSFASFLPNSWNDHQTMMTQPPHSLAVDHYTSSSIPNPLQTFPRLTHPANNAKSWTNSVYDRGFGSSPSILLPNELLSIPQSRDASPILYLSPYQVNYGLFGPDFLNTTAVTNISGRNSNVNVNAHLVTEDIPPPSVIRSSPESHYMSQLQQQGVVVKPNTATDGSGNSNKLILPDPAIGSSLINAHVPTKNINDLHTLGDYHNYLSDIPFQHLKDDDYGSIFSPAMNMSFWRLAPPSGLAMELIEPNVHAALNAHLHSLRNKHNAAHIKHHDKAASLPGQDSSTEHGSGFQDEKVLLGQSYLDETNEWLHLIDTFSDIMDTFQVNASLPMLRLAQRLAYRHNWLEAELKLNSQITTMSQLVAKDTSISSSSLLYTDLHGMTLPLDFTQSWTSGQLFNQRNFSPSLSSLFRSSATLPPIYESGQYFDILQNKSASSGLPLTVPRAIHPAVQYTEQLDHIAKVSLVMGQIARFIDTMLSQVHPSATNPLSLFPSRNNSQQVDDDDDQDTDLMHHTDNLCQQLAMQFPQSILAQIAVSFVPLPSAQTCIDFSDSYRATQRTAYNFTKLIINHLQASHLTQQCEAILRQAIASSSATTSDDATSTDHQNIPKIQYYTKLATILDQIRAVAPLDTTFGHHILTTPNNPSHPLLHDKPNFFHVILGQTPLQSPQHQIAQDLSALTSFAAQKYNSPKIHSKKSSSSSLHSSSLLNQQDEANKTANITIAQSIAVMDKSYREPLEAMPWVEYAWSIVHDTFEFDHVESSLQGQLQSLQSLRKVLNTPFKSIESSSATTSIVSESIDSADCSSSTPRETALSRPLETNDRLLPTAFFPKNMRLPSGLSVEAYANPSLALLRDNSPLQSLYFTQEHLLPFANSQLVRAQLPHSTPQVTPTSTQGQIAILQRLFAKHQTSTAISYMLHLMQSKTPINRTMRDMAVFHLAQNGEIHNLLPRVHHMMSTAQRSKRNHTALQMLDANGKEIRENVNDETIDDQNVTFAIQETTGENSFITNNNMFWDLYQHHRDILHTEWENTLTPQQKQRLWDVQHSYTSDIRRELDSLAKTSEHDERDSSSKQKQPTSKKLSRGKSNRFNSGLRKLASQLHLFSSSHPITPRIKGYYVGNDGKNLGRDARQLVRRLHEYNSRHPYRPANTRYTGMSHVQNESPELQYARRIQNSDDISALPHSEGQHHRHITNAKTSRRRTDGQVYQLRHFNLTMSSYFNRQADSSPLTVNSYENHASLSRRQRILQNRSTVQQQKNTNNAASPQFSDVPLLRQFNGMFGFLSANEYLDFHKTLLMAEFTLVNHSQITPVYAFKRTAGIPSGGTVQSFSHPVNTVHAPILSPAQINVGVHPVTAYEPLPQSDQSTDSSSLGNDTSLTSPNVQHRRRVLPLFAITSQDPEDGLGDISPPHSTVITSSDLLPSVSFSAVSPFHTDVNTKQLIHTATSSTLALTLSGLEAGTHLNQASLGRLLTSLDYSPQAPLHYALHMRNFKSLDDIWPWVVAKRVELRYSGMHRPRRTRHFAPGSRFEPPAEQLFTPVPSGTSSHNGIVSYRVYDIPFSTASMYRDFIQGYLVRSGAQWHRMLDQRRAQIQNILDEEPDTQMQQRRHSSGNNNVAGKHTSSLSKQSSSAAAAGGGGAETSVDTDSQHPEQTLGQQPWFLQQNPIQNWNPFSKEITDRFPPRRPARQNWPENAFLWFGRALQATSRTIGLQSSVVSTFDARSRPDQVAASLNHWWNDLLQLVDKQNSPLLTVRANKQQSWSVASRRFKQSLATVVQRQAGYDAYVSSQQRKSDARHMKGNKGNDGNDAAPTAVSSNPHHNPLFRPARLVETSNLISSDMAQQNQATMQALQAHLTLRMFSVNSSPIAHGGLVSHLREMTDRNPSMNNDRISKPSQSKHRGTKSSSHSPRQLFQSSTLDSLPLPQFMHMKRAHWQGISKSDISRSTFKTYQKSLTARALADYTQSNSAIGHSLFPDQSTPIEINHGDQFYRKNPWIQRQITIQLAKATAYRHSLVDAVVASYNFADALLRELQNKTATPQTFIPSSQTLEHLEQFKTLVTTLQNDFQHNFSSSISKLQHHVGIQDITNIIPPSVFAKDAPYTNVTSRQLPHLPPRLSPLTKWLTAQNLPISPFQLLYLVQIDQTMDLDETFPLAQGSHFETRNIPDISQMHRQTFSPLPFPTIQSPSSSSSSSSQSSSNLVPFLNLPSLRHKRVMQLSHSLARFSPFEQQSFDTLDGLFDSIVKPLFGENRKIGLWQRKSKIYIHHAMFTPSKEQSHEQRQRALQSLLSTSSHSTKHTPETSSSTALSVLIRRDATVPNMMLPPQTILSDATNGGRSNSTNDLQLPTPPGLSQLSLNLPLQIVTTHFIPPNMMTRYRGIRAPLAKHRGMNSGLALWRHHRHRIFSNALTAATFQNTTLSDFSPQPGNVYNGIVSTSTSLNLHHRMYDQTSQGAASRTTFVHSLRVHDDVTTSTASSSSSSLRSDNQHAPLIPSSGVLKQQLSFNCALTFYPLQFKSRVSQIVLQQYPASECLRLLGSEGGHMPSSIPASETTETRSYNAMTAVPQLYIDNFVRTGPVDLSRVASSQIVDQTGSSSPGLTAHIPPSSQHDGLTWYALRDPETVGFPIPSTSQLALASHFRAHQTFQNNLRSAITQNLGSQSLRKGSNINALAAALNLAQPTYSDSGLYIADSLTWPVPIILPFGHDSIQSSSSSSVPSPRQHPLDLFELATTVSSSSPAILRKMRALQNPSYLPGVWNNSTSHQVLVRRGTNSFPIATTMQSKQASEPQDRHNSPNWSLYDAFATGLAVTLALDVAQQGAIWTTASSGPHTVERSIVSPTHFVRVAPDVVPQTKSKHSVSSQSPVSIPTNAVILSETNNNETNIDDIIAGDMLSSTMLSSPSISVSSHQGTLQNSTVAVPFTTSIQHVVGQPKINISSPPASLAFQWLHPIAPDSSTTDDKSSLSPNHSAQCSSSLLTKQKLHESDVITPDNTTSALSTTSVAKQSERTRTSALLSFCLFDDDINYMKQQYGMASTPHTPYAHSSSPDTIHRKRPSLDSTWLAPIGQPETFAPLHKLPLWLEFLIISNARSDRTRAARYATNLSTKLTQAAYDVYSTSRQTFQGGPGRYGKLLHKFALQRHDKTVYKTVSNIVGMNNSGQINPNPNAGLVSGDMTAYMAAQAQSLDHAFGWADEQHEMGFVTKQIPAGADITPELRLQGELAALWTQPTKLPDDDSIIRQL